MATSSPDVRRAGRTAWVDNLRVAAISGVIVVHTATAYVTDFADWYYDDELQPTTVGFAIFAVPALLGGIFGLGPLFWLAGWYSVPSLRHRGPAGFARSRLVRLGIPLAAFVLLVNPLADLVGNVRDEHRSFLAYLGETEFSVMWFVAALLCSTLGYAALRSWRPGPDRGTAATVVGPALGLARGLAWGLAIGALCILVWPLSSLLDEHLMSLRPGAWIQGVALFALGVRAAEATGPGAAVDPDVDRAAACRWGWLTLVGVAAVVALMGVITAEADLNQALHEMSWPGVVFALVYGVVSVSFTLWCLAWFHRRWTGERAWSQRAGRASYATYLLHPLVLTGVMIGLSWIPLGAAPKLVLVAAVGVPACFAVGDALTRAPGLRRLL